MERTTTRSSSRYGMISACDANGVCMSTNIVLADDTIVVRMNFCLSSYGGGTRGLPFFQ